MTDAVVAPGSRSTPLVLALANSPRIRTHVHIDERSAAYYALGLALGSRRPSVVVTTSGTAAAELHPAIVEAHHARVPLIACTADRPPALHEVGAPQTISQIGMFGNVVRWAAAPGPAEALPAGAWRSLAARAFAEAVASAAGPGPVHLNLAFDEPLLGDASELAPARPGGRAWHVAARAELTVLDPQALDNLRAVASRRRGLIVAGGGCGDPHAVVELGVRLGWPILADARSGCRGMSGTVAAFDAILRHEPFAQAYVPEVALRIGAPPASRVLSTWLATAACEQVAVDLYGAWYDPDRTASLVIAMDPSAFCYTAMEELAPPAHPDAGAWVDAEETAQAAIDAVLAGHRDITEPGLARALTALLPEGSPFFVSSSMPVRDVEWFGHPDSRARVFANRGANGIDGIVSTVLGLAAGAPEGEAVVALVGDLAFLHDSNGLIGCESRRGTAVFVVVDNDGGGIFSFLPQARAVDAVAFERLFATPHGLDLARLAEAYGAPVSSVSSIAEATSSVEKAVAAGGVNVVHARTDRTANVAVHDEINAAVAAGLSR